MTVNKTRDGWRIEGKGKDKAVLAFAELEGDNLVYRLEEPTTVA